MRVLIPTLLVLLGCVFFIGSEKSMGVVRAGVGNGETLSTAEPASMPVPTMTPAPLTHSEAQRMEFQVGTYGGTYSVGSWVLWAAQGQTLTLAGNEEMQWLLTVPEGDVPGNGGTTIVLPASGDYTLTVAGVEKFSIDIR